MSVFCLSDIDIQENYRTLFFQDGRHRRTLRVQKQQMKKEKKTLAIMLYFIQ